MMNDLFFARSQMAMSLGFHILFAVVGIAMPLLMVIAEIAWRRTGDRDYFALARNWARGTAVLFAVGAVSGTVLSFELGLLFPTFMKHAGPIFGMPFSLEGFAFFTEAIFLGLYLYGWERLSSGAHIASGIVVALSGLASAGFVIVANAWMNVPRGFRYENGRYLDIDPIGAMKTPFALHEIAHMVAAAYMATGFAVAAIHAWPLLRKRGSGFHRKAFRLALWLAIPFSLVQPLIGDFAGRQVARYQPAKLAAFEQNQITRSHAPLGIGPVEIPGLLSWIAYRDSGAVVRGLQDWAPEDRPPYVVRPAFLMMVTLGMYMAAVSAWALLLELRKRRWTDVRFLLWGVLAGGPMGFLAIEAGWVVTEVGRQPWVIYGFLRTADSVTPMPGLIVPFLVFSGVYLVLSATVIAILRSQIRRTMPQPGDAEVPS